jgi:MFS transporter, PPP family, 3-phenylpropionic acid transporter
LDTQVNRAALRIRHRAAWRLYFLFAALFIPTGLYLIYFPVWLAARGLNDSEIGLVTGAPFVLRVLATPLIAYIADKRGIAVTLAVCAAAMFAGYFSLGFVKGFVPIFLGTLLAISAQGMMPSLADALSLSEIRRLEKARQPPVRYGRVRMAASLSGLSTMLLSGLAVAVFPGARIIWPLIFLAFVAAASAIWAGLTMRPVKFDHAARGGLTENPADLRLAIICIAAGSVTQASHAEIYSFGTLLWEAQGFSPNFIAIAWATGVAFECLLFFTAEHYLGGGNNASRFLILGASGAVLRWSMMALHPSALAVLALQSMHALSFASTYLGTVLLIGSLAGPNHRARMQGWYSTVSSLTMALSMVASGWLTNSFGVGAYLAMAALAFWGLVFALWVAMIRNHQPQSSGAGG